jgi:glycosyltransferase involved in cell wall biosynthesis
VDASLDIVIPVLNEEHALVPAVETLSSFLADNLQEYEWRIVIADNGSTDSTPAICGELSRDKPRVDFIRLEERGRGRALKRAWAESDAAIVAYMDVDLSTGLDALTMLVRAIAHDGYDIAIGSRLRRGARVVGRPLKREIISRAYSLMVRTMFWTGFLDPQCGFKALNRRTVEGVVGLVRDEGWFFDTEMLIVAEKNGYRIKEVPVHWTDDPDSRVRIIPTAYGDLKGLLRLRAGGLRRASRALSERQ